jgi:hydroxymethylbilane synthase
MRALRVGTRGSLLARRQTAWVIEKIKTKYDDMEIEERVITTRGDLQSETPLSKLPQIGEKGLFTREIEGALISGEIDFAVHSLKDLPTDLPAGIALGAVPERANPLDALVSRSRGDLASLPAGKRIGTSSLRRAAQIRRLYPELEITDIRGNLDTRLRKLLQETVDALILAAAGLERMGWQPHAYSLIPPEECLPAPGQGALAVEIREDDLFMRQLCGAALEDPSARLAVTAERAFLTGLGGGCQVPVGALALVRGDLLRLQGIVIQVDGQRWLSGAADARPEEAFEAGISLANRLLEQGAGEILAASDNER